MTSLQSIIKTAQSKGYTIDKRPFALNIIGVRNSNPTDQKSFDDEIAYFYYDPNGNPVGKVAPATTDPSVFYLENPLAQNGTGILKAGEYRDTWSIGLHKGKYEALVQTIKPVTTIRDNDRNAVINYLAPTVSGFFGINIHKASSGKGDIRIIDKDSAGCQVFRDEQDFDQMMNYAKNSRTKYGNTFSYILIDRRDTLKLVNTTAIGLLLIGVGYYYYLKNKGK